MDNALIGDQQCRVGEVIGPRSQQIILSDLVSFSDALYDYMTSYIRMCLSYYHLHLRERGHTS